jgi:hypothetical protein
MNHGEPMLNTRWSRLTLEIAEERSLPFGAAIAVLGTFFMLMTPTVAGARGPTCTATARHAHVDARSSSALMYDRRGVLYGCWRPARRVTQLLAVARLDNFTPACPYAARPGTPAWRHCDMASSIAFPRLAGRFAGFASGADDEDAFTSGIYVVDLVRGRLLYGLDSSDGNGIPSASVTYYYVRSFALDSRGRTAWGHEWFPDAVCSYGCVAPSSGSDQPEVHAHDSRGSRLLDDSSDVAVRSVSINRGSVTWLRGGTRQTVALR